MEITSYSSEYSWIANIHPDRAIFQGEGYRFVKRFMDLFLTIISMPVWLPLMGLSALVIWIESPGSKAIFTQMRTGKGGKRFKLLKLRTMVSNAEELKKELAHLNELEWPDFKITNDPRITRFGRFLRKTSLDELPQLLNVLKNDMSLVGPRPTSFSSETYKLWQTERLDVVPGITGLWQIYGRGKTEFNERLKMDIAYVNRRCIWLDIQIIFRTLMAVFQQRGAH
jgi:lipopolysaccharide/colanic/teichoic acid biosynthesis glycosyltransferase